MYVDTCNKSHSIFSAIFTNYLKNKDSKPSIGFQNYMENIDKDVLSREIMLLKNSGYETNEEVLNKFKKTYKNRYFIQTKK